MIRQTQTVVVMVSPVFFELGGVLEGGFARGWFARRPAIPWHLVSDGNHPMLRKYPLELSATSTESCEYKRSRAVRPKVLVQISATSSVKLPHASAAAYSEISTFRTLSVKFPTVLSAGLSAQSFRRTFRAKLPGTFLQGFCTDVCREMLPKSLRTQYLGLTCAETGPTNRLWTDAPQTERPKTSDRFPQRLSCPCSAEKKRMFTSQT